MLRLDSDARRRNFTEAGKPDGVTLHREGEAERERVVADTLVGHPAAEREWTERGMIETVDGGLRHFGGPVGIVVGENDRVERADALRAAFAEVPQVAFTVLPGVGLLAPIEDPAVIAAACRAVGSTIRRR